MQFLLSNLPEVFFNFIHFQTFGVSGAAILFFCIFTFVVFPLFYTVYISLKNKAIKKFFETGFFFLFAIWLLSVSSIIGPFFFYLANYTCTSYEATSCFLTSLVVVVIGFMSMSYVKKETEKISIMENAYIKEEVPNTMDDSNKSNEGIVINMYE